MLSDLAFYSVEASAKGSRDPNLFGRPHIGIDDSRDSLHHSPSSTKRYSK